MIIKLYFRVEFFIKTIPNAEIQTKRKGIIPANKILPLLFNNAKQTRNQNYSSSKNIS